MLLSARNSIAIKAYLILIPNSTPLSPVASSARYTKVGLTPKVSRVTRTPRHQSVLAGLQLNELLALE